VAIMESKKRGSVFVLLSPKNEVECDLLAACHVLGTGYSSGRALQTPSHLDELCELAEIFTPRRLLNLTIEEAKCAAVFGNVGYAVATVISVPKQPGWSVGFLDICRSGHNIKILHCKKPADFQISEAAHRSGRPGFNFGSLPWVWSGPASCRPTGPSRDVGNLPSYWR
jgi:hypothetical protein